MIFLVIPKIKTTLPVSSVLVIQWSIPSLRITRHYAILILFANILAINHQFSRFENCKLTFLTLQILLENREKQLSKNQHIHITFLFSGMSIPDLSSPLPTSQPFGATPPFSALPIEAASPSKLDDTLDEISGNASTGENVGGWRPIPITISREPAPKAQAR